jgi:CheY-like chemotaxis protein
VSNDQASEPKVLVVEDEFLVSLVLTEMLEELGYQIAATAARLGDAIVLAKSGDFDLAILDVNLGGERSYPLADILSAAGKPFLFSTGYDQLDSRYRQYPRLQKPYCQEDLAKALDGIVGFKKSCN